MSLQPQNTRRLHRASNAGRRLRTRKPAGGGPEFGTDAVLLANAANTAGEGGAMRRYALSKLCQIVFGWRRNAVEGAAARGAGGGSRRASRGGGGGGASTAAATLAATLATTLAASAAAFPRVVALHCIPHQPFAVVINVQLAQKAVVVRCRRCHCNPKTRGGCIGLATPVVA